MVKPIVAAKSAITCIKDSIGTIIDTNRKGLGSCFDKADFCRPLTEDFSQDAKPPKRFNRKSIKHFGRHFVSRNTGAHAKRLNQQFKGVSP